MDSLNDLFEGFSSDARGVSPIVFACVILIGLANCFFGYRIFRLWVALYGLVFGGAWAFVGAQQAGAGDQAVWWALVGGVLGAAIAWAVYLVGVFAVGFGVGTMIASALFPADPHPGIAIGSGVAGGVLFVACQRPLIILATASSGAWYAVVGALFFIEGALIPLHVHPVQIVEILPLTMLLAWISLAIVGMIVQARDPRKDGSARASRPESGIVSPSG